MIKPSSGKSPYAVRLRKLSPRPVARSAKQNSQSSVNEVMLMRPTKTRVNHRVTNSYGGRDNSTTKVFPMQLFSHPLELEVTSIPFKLTEPKSTRARQISPKTLKQYPPPCPPPSKPRYTPKSNVHHRRTLSMIEDFGDRNHTEKHGFEEGGGGGASVVAKWGVSTRMGFIPGNPGKVNQDAFVAADKLIPEAGISLFAVCDGHGVYGHDVSGYLKSRLPKSLLQDPSFPVHPGSSLVQSLLRLNQEVLMGSIDSSMSGSTCVSVLMQGKSLWCANIGDSRAVMGRKGGEKRGWTTVSLSRDHKPDLKDEAERILNMGGRVAAYQDTDGSPIGPARVWLKHQDTPGLAMSRSIGDAVAVSAGVIGTPEVLHLCLTKEDKFIVLGSDGVFEFLSSEEIVRIVAGYWEKGEVQGACEAVEKEAYIKWAQVSGR